MSATLPQALSELALKASEIRKDITQKKMAKSVGRLEKPHLLKAARRELARTETKIHAEKLKLAAKK